MMDYNNGCFIPPNIDIESGQRPIFAIDININFENDQSHFMLKDRNHPQIEATYIRP